MLPMEKLTIQEEEAMLSIWQLQGGFVKEILDNLKGEKPPYTTLASTIKNLERKGYVEPRRYANANRYEPVVTEEQYKAKFMNGFVGDYFRNSYKEMVSFFVKEEKLSEKELTEIMDMIKNNKS
ncbi:Predicted transcriptional regulator [Sphingobacterium psychroaquaticum]|uniref:Predicted transcriptional regulator n=2 Tax=Sphingobacterium psychroaquaticum TaxID=561061 RepID=A0A1X7KRQ1_9SPHI|nr:Predicted transcriptional regulator [Sphingobacterium psychroaquaticum]